MEKLNIEIHELCDFTPTEEKKFREATKLCKEVINSKEFKDRVINYEWIHNGVVYKEFKKNKGISNKNIFKMFISGSDLYNPIEDHDLDISTTLYYSWKKTVGYTYKNTFKTWINRKYFTHFKLPRIVENIVHEYMHNEGFGHALKNNSTRKHTVPYAYGYIARTIAEDILEENSYGNYTTKYPEEKKRKCTGWWIFKRCKTL